MSPNDQWRSRRSRWWSEMQGENGPEGTADSSQEWTDRLRRHRPPWWPENEPWPPARRRWWHGRRGPFFRRLGCFFLLFNLVGAAFFVGVVVMLLNALGLVSVGQFQFQASWLLPLVGVLLAMLVATALAGIISLRRMSFPLDDLLAASHRVAEGDY